MITAIMGIPVISMPTNTKTIELTANAAYSQKANTAIRDELVIPFGNP